MTVVLLVLALMFLLFQAGKFIAYAPEVMEWFELNWPGYMP